MKKKIDPYIVLAGYEAEEAILADKVERVLPPLPPRKRARCLVRLNDLRKRLVPALKGTEKISPPPQESLRE